MGFDQYHEPPEELSQQTRTFARMITSLTEEAEAIGWYEQRISVEKKQRSKSYHGECTTRRDETFWDGPGIFTSQKTRMENDFKVRAFYPR